ncbi:MAG: TIR domain-containing protein [Oscillospiraceae bacterium]|nr:TIR domain-containing protein [Oscillospiraceae bacterium]
MTHDVFISHSSKNKVTADAICHTLENNGIRCWIAPRDVMPGVEYAEELIRGIENCYIFLLVFSKDANISGPVGKEVESAFRYGKTVMPYRIEEVEMSKSFEYHLANLHWLDAFPDDSDFRKLTAAIKNALGGKNAAPAAPVAASAAPQSWAAQLGSGAAAVQAPVQAPPVQQFGAAVPPPVHTPPPPLPQQFGGVVPAPAQAPVPRKKSNAGLIVAFVLIAAAVFVAIAVFVIALVLRESSPGDTPISPPQGQDSSQPIYGDHEIAGRLVGRWVCVDDDNHIWACDFRFESGNRFIDGDGDSGIYQISGDEIKFIFEDSYDAVTLKFSLSDNHLVLDFNDGYPVTLTRGGS